MTRIAPAQADCPASEAVCEGEVSTPTTPTFHTTCGTWTLDVAWIDYDVPAGTLYLSYSEAMTIALSLRDDFTVVGPATGTPVPLHLRLRFSGVGSGYGYQFPAAGGTMWIRTLEPEPGEIQVEKTYGVPFGTVQVTPFSDSLDFTFTRPAGTPFGLEIHGDAQRGYNLINNIRFAFLDLPPGATVTSCKGYRQEQPTPAVARSWGRLKAAYR